MTSRTAPSHIGKQELATATGKTRQVILQTKSAIDHDNNNNNNEGSCELRVFDETGLYQGVVKKTEEQILVHLDKPASSSDGSHVEIQLDDHQQQQDNNSIQEEVMTFRVWKIDENEMVKDIVPVTKLTRAASSGKGLMSLMFHLMHDADEQAQKMKQVEEEAKAWRMTAEDLEGGWEREKSVLFGNFLKLYNQRQTVFGEALERVGQLEAESAHLKQELAASAKIAPKNPRAPPVDDSNIPVDDDAKGFDLEEARRLAGGPVENSMRTKKSFKSSATKRDENVDGRQKKQRTEKASNSSAAKGDERPLGRQRNPVTGAYEYDGEAIFDDPELFPPEKESQDNENNEWTL